MRRFIILLAALVAAGNIAIDSQTRTSSGRNGHRQHTEQSSRRPSHGTDHGNHGKDNRKRPQNDRHDHKPGHVDNRPPHHPDRPGIGHHAPSRPPHTPAMRPPHRPDHRPLPPRPHYNYHRPPRPHNWHYISGAPSLGQIIGITLGTAFVTAIDNLTSRGIAYTPYGDNMVSVTNVSQFGYIWPRATLYYTDGLLTGGEFSYYSHSAGRNRYTQLYNRFTSQWGYPASVSSKQATWFTPDNGFVTLDHTYSSPYGYVTTLTLGH